MTPLDSTHLLLSGAVVLISLLFSVVTWFVVRLLAGVESRFAAQDLALAEIRARLADHSQRWAVYDDRQHRSPTP